MTDYYVNKLTTSVMQWNTAMWLSDELSTEICANDAVNHLVPNNDSAVLICDLSQSIVCADTKRNVPKIIYLLTLIDDYPQNSRRFYSYNKILPHCIKMWKLYRLVKLRAQSAFCLFTTLIYTGWHTRYTHTGWHRKSGTHTHCTKYLLSRGFICGGVFTSLFENFLKYRMWTVQLWLLCRSIRKCAQVLGAWLGSTRALLQTQLTAFSWVHLSCYYSVLGWVWQMGSFEWWFYLRRSRGEL